MPIDNYFTPKKIKHPSTPVGRQMTIENPVSIDFLSTFVDIINVFDCRLSGVETKPQLKVSSERLLKIDR